MRVAMGIEYDGSPYYGWQVQKHSRNTVQEAVEKALSRVANHPVRVLCAGRTDTGVHGMEQVIHFDTEAYRDERSWVFGANTNLPKSVVVLWAKPISVDFHARFTAERRRYVYVIFNRNVRPTFLSHRTTWEYRSLDVDRMIEAAQCLIGEHDFTSYRALACQAHSPVRVVNDLQLYRRGHFIYMSIEANGFLHHMVRNIAGVLMDIGAGKQPVDWAKTILDHQDRALGGVTAPPYGLYLQKITYPEEFHLPQLPRFDPVW
ncbi:MAG: tRNA pseudouridine(38-40) synthase TruA [Gammaproteobacteria bacterium]|nr:tRNA pseudouridine(38-40) synthase TruA [Gammaproteobacteria bacterium]MDH5731164.1 tRNA pseudouridine(38-40) synthase TruA [Gammaproteobacteria bacterium]